MTETKTQQLFRQKLELLILSQDVDVLNRTKEVVSRHFITFKHMPFSELPETSPADLVKAQLVLMDQEPDEDLVSFSQRLDRVLNLFPRSRVVVVLASSKSREVLQGAQNPRVTPLSQAEFKQTLKFEYICLYRCRAQYFEIQFSDLFPMTTVTFPIFVRLSLNQRYLAVAYSASVLSDGRYQRVSKAENTYIANKDSEKYLRYISTYYDTSGNGLKKRARALFLALCSEGLLLNDIILFDFKSVTAEEVQSRYESLNQIVQELVQIMESEENLWDLFREAISGSFYELWRAPWIAVYGALISKKSGQGDPVVTLLSGMLTDVGLFDLDAEISRKYLFSESRSVGDADQSQFANHPILSLNRCLGKGLPVSEAVKAVMVCTHERFDEEGFPNKVPADKIPVEAQILQFAERIDQGVLTTLKNTGVGFRFMKEKLWEAERKSPGAFSPDFLEAIAESLI